VNSFRSFTIPHAFTLVSVATAIVVFVRAGVAWGGTRKGKLLESAVAIAILGMRAGVFVWNALPARLSLERSLPIQICDLAAICSGLALTTAQRWTMAIAYFWGIAFSLQGLVQPDLNVGPGSLAFWLFWLHHALIVGTAAYLVVVRRFRPTIGDLRTAVIGGLGYVAVVFPLDFVLNANYGYLGRRTPDQPTLLDYLGPWPWRVLVMITLGSIVLVALYLPWALARGRSRDYREVAREAP
jgi:hypothetical integral membrane protein (TIGR02206 family)